MIITGSYWYLVCPKYYLVAKVIQPKPDWLDRFRCPCFATATRKLLKCQILTNYCVSHGKCTITAAIASMMYTTQITQGKREQR